MQNAKISNISSVTGISPHLITI